MRTQLHVALTLLFSAVLVGRVYPQATLTSDVLRDSVNAIVPGLVAPDGNFDPNDPDVAQVTRLILWLDGDPVEDLQGLEYFTSLDTLQVYFDGTHTPLDTCRIPDFPPSLKELALTNTSGLFEIGQLPDNMERVYIGSAFDPSSAPRAHIERFGAGLDKLVLDCPQDISWGDTADVADLSIAFTGACGITGFTMSPARCEHFNLYGNDPWWIQDTLDASAVECERMNLTNFGIHGTFIWPAYVPSIVYSPNNGNLLPNWPAVVDSITLTDGISCIPLLPNSLRYFNIGTASCIPNWPNAMEEFILNYTQVQQNELTYCSVLNSSCPGIYPSLSGSVMMDLNGNGVVDVGEPPIAGSTITIAPGGQLTGNSPDGTWEIGVPTGEHTISVANNYTYATGIAPTTHVASVPNLGDIDANNDFAVAVLPDIQDLRVHLYASPARPGFENEVHVRCENYGTTTIDATLNLAFDADQNWVSSSLAPTSQSGSAATWNFPAMPIGSVQQITVTLNTAATVALGTDITHTLTADPLATDETPADNTHTFSDSVVGSYDPNDKLLTPAVLSPAQVAAGETPIEYTIRFQNTGTFLAERVVILDTLSTDLQWESMRFIASSHANHWYITDGVLHVIHNDIMLPDSTSDEPGSHGFIQFSMLPKTDLNDGATVTNIAHIVFDFNEPIITPPAVFSVDIEAGLMERSSEPRLRLSPNPADDRIQLRVDGSASLRYRIIDVLGSQIQFGTTTANSWVNVEKLPAGPYLMEVEQGGARTFERFVKQ